MGFTLNNAPDYRQLSHHWLLLCIAIRLSFLAYRLIVIKFDTHRQSDSCKSMATNYCTRTVKWRWLRRLKQCPSSRSIHCNNPTPCLRHWSSQESNSRPTVRCSLL